MLTFQVFGTKIKFFIQKPALKCGLFFCRLLKLETSRFIFFYICEVTMNRMKRLIAAAIIAFAFVSLESCEKCATCVTTEDDPNATEDSRTTEICGRGRNYSDQITIYERTNWECTEN